MLGKDLLIAMGGRVIAAQRTCSLNMQQDTIEVCSPVSGPWREYIPSTLGWNVSCDGLIYAPEYADELMDVLTSRQKVRLSYYDPKLHIVRSGYAIPTGLQEGASISDLASYSLTFQGSGELARVESVEVESAGEGGVFLKSYAYDQDRNHAVRYLEGMATGLYVRPVSFDTLTKLVISSQHVVAVYTSSPVDAIKAQNNLALYQMEIEHNGEDGTATILMPPGVTYYVVGHCIPPIVGEGPTPSFQMNALSLPTE